MSTPAREFYCGRVGGMVTGSPCPECGDRTGHDPSIPYPPPRLTEREQKLVDAARAEALRDAALLCEALAMNVDATKSQFSQAFADAADACAEAIRSAAERGPKP